jgi:hypothetical protein
VAWLEVERRWSHDTLLVYRRDLWTFLSRSHHVPRDRCYGVGLLSTSPPCTKARGGSADFLPKPSAARAAAVKSNDPWPLGRLVKDILGRHHAVLH